MSDQNRSFERSGQEQDGQQAHNSHCHAPGRRRLDRPIQFGTAPHVAPLQTAFELVFTADDAVQRRFVLANNKLVATPGYAAQLLGLTNVVASGQGTFTNPNSGPSADSGQVSDKSAAASSADEEDLEVETNEEDDAEAEPAAFLRKGKIRVTCDRCRLYHQQCDILDQPMSSFPLPPDDMVLVLE
ncbi:hypothetical protein VTO58DRAFT_107419 [Aureobasidium pullulans]